MPTIKTWNVNHHWEMRIMVGFRLRIFCRQFMNRGIITPEPKVIEWIPMISQECGWGAVQRCMQTITLAQPAFDGPYQVVYMVSRPHRNPTFIDVQRQSPDDSAHDIVRPHSPGRCSRAFGMKQQTRFHSETLLWIVPHLFARSARKTANEVVDRLYSVECKWGWRGCVDDPIFDRLYHIIT